MRKLEDYGEMAGLKINWKKTKILTKNMQKEDQNILMEMTGFIQESRVRYLGIHLSNKTSTLMEDNYLKLLQELQKDLARRDKLQLSFMGRIATINMNVLPRILFLFQMTPVILKQTFFKDLNKIIQKFI